MIRAVGQSQRLVAIAFLGVFVVRFYQQPVLALVAGGYFFDVLDLTIFGALVPDMIKSGFITAPQVAAVGSATLVGLLIGCVGQGEFTDRFGRKAVFRFAVLCYSLATIAAALAPTAGWLVLGRFIAGIFLGSAAPLRVRGARRGRWSARQIGNLRHASPPRPVWTMPPHPDPTGSVAPRVPPPSPW